MSRNGRTGRAMTGSVDEACLRVSGERYDRCTHTQELVHSERGENCPGREGRGRSGRLSSWMFQRPRLLDRRRCTAPQAPSPVAEPSFVIRGPCSHRRAPSPTSSVSEPVQKTAAALVPCDIILFLLALIRFPSICSPEHTDHGLESAGRCPSGREIRPV